MRSRAALLTHATRALSRPSIIIRTRATPLTTRHNPLHHPQRRTMATAAATVAQVHLTPEVAGAFHVPVLTPQAAEKASELLQENHEKFHIFCNEDQFHNHIVHHILTVFSLGADPETIQKQYDLNKTYQRPVQRLHERVLADLASWETRKKYLGKEQYTYDFEKFYEQEIERLGIEGVLKECLFKGDEAADDLLIRLYMGFLHPFIHLGFALSYRQPAILAEALAQCAAHGDWQKPLHFGAEKLAGPRNGHPAEKPLVQLLDEIRADTKLSTAAQWADGNKIRDGILRRAPDEMLKYAAQWTVGPDELDEKVAELVNAVVYYTACAQHPPKIVKFDFYYMHCVNSSIFLPDLLALDIPVETKCRVLEWKGRLDLAMYASRRSPELLLEEATGYQPKVPGDWESVFKRVREYPDDGHASKLVRAIKWGEVVCKPYEHKESFRVKGDMWLKIGHMVIDSVEDEGKNWARSVGFEEAWVEYPDRKPRGSQL